MLVADQTDLDLVRRGDWTRRNIMGHLGSEVDAICSVYLLWGNLPHLCKVIWPAGCHCFRCQGMRVNTYCTRLIHSSVMASLQEIKHAKCHIYICLCKGSLKNCASLLWKYIIFQLPIFWANFPLSFNKREIYLQKSNIIHKLHVDQKYTKLFLKSSDPYKKLDK
jgi:hypothetical protein